MSMKDGKRPDPDTVHPIAGYDKEIYAPFAAISAKANCLRINAQSATRIRAILWAEYETNEEFVSGRAWVTRMAKIKIDASGLHHHSVLPKNASPLIRPTDKRARV